MLIYMLVWYNKKQKHISKDIMRSDDRNLIQNIKYKIQTKKEVYVF